MGGDCVTILNETLGISFYCVDWMDSVPSYEQINKMAHYMKWNSTDRVYGFCCINNIKPCNNDIKIILNNKNEIYDIPYFTNDDKIKIINSIKIELEAYNNSEYYKEPEDHFPVWKDNICSICNGNNTSNSSYSNDESNDEIIIYI